MLESARDQEVEARKKQLSVPMKRNPPHKCREIFKQGYNSPGESSTTISFEGKLKLVRTDSNTSVSLCNKSIRVYLSHEYCSVFGL